MKKLLCLLTLLLLLTGCGNRVDLLPGAEAFELDIYLYDGKTVRDTTLYDRDAEQILRILQNEIRKPVKVDISSLQPPVYGFKGNSDNKWDSVGGLWADGIFLCEDGTAYALEEDFSKWFDGIYRGSMDRLSLIPCIHFLAKADGQWNPEYLYAICEEPEHSVGISMELVEQTDTDLTVRFRNETAKNWHYYYHYDLDVCIGDLWYRVPLTYVPASVQPQWAGLPVEADKYATGTIPIFADYGRLPAGQYRLVVQGMTLEFDIE